MLNYNFQECLKTLFFSNEKKIQKVALWTLGNILVSNEKILNMIFQEKEFMLKVLEFAQNEKINLDVKL